MQEVTARIELFDPPTNMRICAALSERDISTVKKKANTIRRHIITSTAEAGSGHPGGSLSCADIIALMYFHVLELKPHDPGWHSRDRFLLAKGHAAPALYAALAERGFFPPEELLNLRTLGAMLQGHPDMTRTPGVEASTGSLGQGLSVAVGMALAAKLDSAEYGVYALLGDGEIQEGQVWEAAMAAAHYQLNNLVAIVDYNRLQIDGPVDEVMSPSPVIDKWASFGWEVMDTDGHNISQLHATLQCAQEADRPAAVIAHTVKGKGVSYMENQVQWHGKAPEGQLVEQALRELESVEEVDANE